ncbi:hypothetical protein [Aurantiacibacter flavus]|uniref:Uncharacterized protein n=1 Tax=Aurantiacibacter flavus TaxID=3145232 RepID=A0ABV0D022_9SPHN
MPAEFGHCDAERFSVQIDIAFTPRQRAAHVARLDALHQARFLDALMPFIPGDGRTVFEGKRANLAVFGHDCLLGDGQEKDRRQNSVDPVELSTGADDLFGIRPRHPDDRRLIFRKRLELDHTLAAQPIPAKLATRSGNSNGNGRAARSRRRDSDKKRYAGISCAMEQRRFLGF